MQNIPECFRGAAFFEFEFLRRTAH